jgi:hypothetical protein
VRGDITPLEDEDFAFGFGGLDFSGWEGLGEGEE